MPQPNRLWQMVGWLVGAEDRLPCQVNEPRQHLRHEFLIDGQWCESLESHASRRSTHTTRNNVDSQENAGSSRNAPSQRATAPTGKPLPRNRFSTSRIAPPGGATPPRSNTAQLRSSLLQNSTFRRSNTGNTRKMGGRSESVSVRELTLLCIALHHFSPEITREQLSDAQITSMIRRKMNAEPQNRPLVFDRFDEHWVQQVRAENRGDFHRVGRRTAGGRLYFEALDDPRWRALAGQTWRAYPPASG